MVSHTLPVIIQGGMGVGVSAWPLARAVSLTGQLGVVSGTALDVVLVRRLQLGDRGGHLRRALAAFPFPEMAARILDRYFVPQSKPAESPFAHRQVIGAEPSQEELELVVAANFVEVYLAKENHTGIVGINYLEKIQLPTLPSLFGAMLAGVDYVLMGAGIPRAIPGVLDRLSRGEPCELPLNINGAGSDDHFAARFSPLEFARGTLPPLERPHFLAIIASSALAQMLARKASGRVDGFVVEGPTAGGHNAPPRGELSLNSRGEPLYGERDLVDLDSLRALGLPFWLAGSYGSPEQLRAALDEGATGVQVGTAFAFCDESGLSDPIKQRVSRICRNGQPDVFTDPVASPTGFPFKVLRLPGTLSEAADYRHRRRICDLGFLRQGYRKPDGTLGWRCPGEPVDAYVRKGGQPEETRGRKCICNALVANIGLAQVRRDGRREQPLVTCGNDLSSVARLLELRGTDSYSAQDVVRYLAGHDRPLAVARTQLNEA
jgi:nitronate monooxygenase